MPTIELKNTNGDTVEQLKLDDAVFAAPQNAVVTREVVNAFLANQRQGTHKTKTRGEVSGGGRKPWKQKGTGRARQGSTRAPQWRGGAIIFGPVPRDYREKVNKKKRRAAFRTVLSSRVETGQLIVVDALDFASEPKTSRFVATLDKLGAEGRVLVVVSQVDEALLRVARNVPYARVELAGSLSIYDLLTADTIVATRDAVAELESTLAGTAAQEA
jgi:large subunit ribosomal protein L4